MLRLQPEQPADRAAADALIDDAFGPGRYAKAAERLREGSAQRLDLSMTARADDKLVGVVRLWPVRIGETPALLLGPIAVDQTARGQGLSARLTEAACRRAAEAGERLVLLVGEERLFGPLGFVRAPPGRVSLPGPVDPGRLFVRELAPGAFDAVSGPVRGFRAPPPRPNSSP